MSSNAAVLLTAVLLAAACTKAQQTPAAGAPGAPTLELFVMSQCPYGVQVVDAAAEAKKTLGDAFQLKIQYIGEGTAGALTAMHGPSEVKGNLAQICAINHAPDRYLEMLVCQNQDMRNVDTNWRACAAQARLDVERLASCIEGDEGQKLLAASYQEAARRGATGSPTIYVAGKEYQGGRKPRDFVRAVCEAHGDAPPEACKKLPVPPRVDAVFFSDSRCKECDLGGLAGQLKGELPGVVITNVDYSTAEGKALYAELKQANPEFKYLPAILLGKEVEKDADAYPTLRRFLRPVGDRLELQLGGQFDPRAEICANAGADDDGDGKGDCDDSDCKQAMTCRPTVAGKLDLFVMSECPYGAQAMMAAKQVADHFKGDLKLDVHYIGDKQGDTLTSMHGQSEVDEDIRQICAVKKYGKRHQFMDYLACRSADYKNPDWKPCASGAGMRPEVIQACFDGEGKKLLGDSFAFSQSLAMSASPTLLINNKETGNAVAAAQMQALFCKHNENLAPCKTPIATPVDAAGAMPAAAAGGSCGDGSAASASAPAEGGACEPAP